MRPPHPPILAHRPWLAPMQASRVKIFEIYRYDPDSANPRRLESFEIDLEECGPMMLDVYPLHHMPTGER